MNVAQTALSTQIQDLEAELGFKLFDRLPRGVKLSAAGKLFLADARRILRDVNEAASRAARVARSREAVFVFRGDGLPQSTGGSASTTSLYGEIGQHRRAVAWPCFALHPDTEPGLSAIFGNFDTARESM